MNVQAMSVTTIVRANAANPEIVVVPHVSFADALDHARDLNTQLTAEGRMSSWRIIGFREVDGKPTTFWAAQSRPLPVKSPVQQLVDDLAKEFEGLVDIVHRDELARAQQQMKIDALAGSSIEGYRAAALFASDAITLATALSSVASTDSTSPLGQLP